MDGLLIEKNSASRIGKATIAVENSPMGQRWIGKRRKNTVGKGTVENSKYVFPCKITANNGGGEYQVEIYADGKTEPSTGNGILHLLEVHIQEELDIGTWVVGFSSTVKETG